MRYFKLAIISFCTVCFLISCEKNEFPKKYAWDSYAPGELRMFTNSGEVTDPAVIRQFISEEDQLFWPDPYINDVNWRVEIELISENKARIWSASDTQEFNLIRQDGIIYFELNDTITTSFNLNDPHLLYSPLFIQEIPSWGNYYAAFSPCVYVMEENEELHIPVMCYLEKIYNQEGELMIGTGYSNYNNIINVSYLNQIMERSNIDTIVYQQNEVIFTIK